MARPEILLVKEVRSTGVLLLEGADHSTVTENAVNCAPCHLPILLDSDTSTSEVRPSRNAPCEHCGLPDDPSVLLICSACQRLWHTYCVGLGLSVPPGVWVCAQCITAGVDPTTGMTPRAQLQSRRTASVPRRGVSPRHPADLQGSLLSCPPFTPTVFTRSTQKTLPLRSRKLR
jgi:hypothetical protein